MQRTRKLFAATLVAVAAASCGERAGEVLTTPEGARPRLATAVQVQVCCASTRYVGAQYQVYATAYDSVGQPIANPLVQWSTSSNGVAGIAGSSTTALVTPAAVGQTTIYANVNGVVGSTTLTVTAAPVVTTVQIVAAPLSVQMGYPELVTARAYDQNGNLISGTSFTWTVQSTSIATVSSGGTVTPVAPGTTTLTATASGVSGTAQLTVTPYLDASMSGPNTVWYAGNYEWSVQPSGGSGTYTYEWWIDYVWGSQSQLISTGSSVGLYVDENTGPFLIRVAVHSAGSTVEPGTMVCNFIAGAHC
jgi:hypothetical protein